MTLRTQTILAGMILMALCGAAEAKPQGCGCHRHAKAIPHADSHHAQRSHEHHAYASRQNRYYDYYHARRLNEDVYHTRQYAWRDEHYESRSRDYGYSYESGNSGDHHARTDGPQTSLNSRDFTGGVGYGQNGDMGYAQGGYGRFDPYNGNTAGMNGGAMNDRARMSVWHGYYGHNGLGNGY